MASDGRADSNHLDQSSQSVSSAAAAKGKGGRPPHPIKEEFIKVGSSANASKRATYDCKHCNTSFTEQQATNPNLIKHIVSECSQCPSETRQKKAAADESDEEEVTPQEMQAALSKQYEADQRAQQEASVPDECRRDWRAAMRWALAVENGVDLLSPGYQEVLQAAQPRQISAPVPGINPRAIATQFILQQQQAAAAAAQAQALAVGVGMPVPYQAVMLHQVQALQQQQQTG